LIGTIILAGLQNLNSKANSKIVLQTLRNLFVCVKAGLRDEVEDYKPEDAARVFLECERDGGTVFTDVLSWFYGRRGKLPCWSAAACKVVLH